MRSIEELLKKQHIKAKNISLFEQALTHSSYNADANTKHHDYEKLEFLGDSVIGLAVADFAYEYREDMNQGTLTKLKSNLVNTHALASYARKIQLDQYIRVGNSFTTDVSKAEHLLEDAFEAFVGAIYLDVGFNRAKQFVKKIFIKDIMRFELSDSHDYKSKLQEEIQAEHRESVVYEVIDEIGPAHDREFVVRVLFDGIELGRGSGKSKKEAEQMAAKRALEKKA